MNWRKGEDKTEKGMIERLFPHLYLKESFSKLTLQLTTNNPPQLRRSNVVRKSSLLIKEGRKLLMILSAISFQSYLCAFINTSEIKGEENSQACL